MPIWDEKDKKICGKTLVAWLSCVMASFVVILVLALFYSIVTTSGNQEHIKKMMTKRGLIPAQNSNSCCPNSRVVRSVTEKPPAGNGIFSVDSENLEKKNKTNARALNAVYGTAEGIYKGSHIIANDVEVTSSEIQPRNNNFPVRLFGGQFSDYYDLLFYPTDYLHHFHINPEFRKNREKRIVTTTGHRIPGDSKNNIKNLKMMAKASQIIANGENRNPNNPEFKVKHSDVVRSATEKPPAGHAPNLIAHDVEIYASEMERRKPKFTNFEDKNPVKKLKTKVRGLINSYGTEKDNKKKAHFIALGESKNSSVSARSFGNSFPDFHSTNYVSDFPQNPEFKNKEERTVTSISQFGTSSYRHSRVIRSATETPPAGHGIFNIDSQNPVKKVKPKLRTLIETYGNKKGSHFVVHEVEVDSSEIERSNPNFPARLFGGQVPDYYDIPFAPTDYLSDYPENPEFKNKEKRMVAPIPNYVLDQQKGIDVTSSQEYIMNTDGNEKSNRTKRI